MLVVAAQIAKDLRTHANGFLPTAIPMMYARQSAEPDTANLHLSFTFSCPRASKAVATQCKRQSRKVRQAIKSRSFWANAQFVPSESDSVSGRSGTAGNIADNVYYHNPKYLAVCRQWRILLVSISAGARHRPLCIQMHTTTWVARYIRTHPTNFWAASRKEPSTTRALVLPGPWSSKSTKRPISMSSSISKAPKTSPAKLWITSMGASPRCSFPAAQPRMLGHNNQQCSLPAALPRLGKCLAAKPFSSQWLQWILSNALQMVPFVFMSSFLFFGIFL